MAPCPWHRLLPTGGVDASETSITEWFKSGAAAVGLGSKLISSQTVKDKNYDSIAAKTAQCIGWVGAARGESLFSGVEHIGLYAHKSSPEALSAWYQQTFNLQCKESAGAFFASGSGAGRIEFPKASADAQTHIAMRVSNFESAAAYLQARGIGLHDVAIKPERKHGYLDVTDPEGNLIHLLWLPKK